MTWMDVDGEKLLEPPLVVKDFIRAIKASRPTVSGEDLKRNSEWTAEVSSDRLSRLYKTNISAVWFGRSIAVHSLSKFITLFRHGAGKHDAAFCMRMRHVIFKIHAVSTESIEPFVLANTKQIRLLSSIESASARERLPCSHRGNTMSCDAKPLSGAYVYCLRKFLTSH